jgi:tripartite-type tricarboxylate transporter receptor subunit TctC
MEFAARQPPDGYSFVIGNLGPAAVNRSSAKSLTALKGFLPDLADLDRAERAGREFRRGREVARRESRVRARQPGKLSYGTSGPGSVSHLSSEMLKNLTKATWSRFRTRAACSRCRTARPADPFHLLRRACRRMQHIRAGKLRALCYTGHRRFALLADLPTATRRSGSGAVNWWGVLMPAGTPRAIADKFHAGHREGDAGCDGEGEIRRSRRRGRQQHAPAVRAFIKAEMDKYARLIKDAGIKAQ